MKQIYYFLFLAIISLTGHSQQTYYNDVNLTLTGTALRDELATKIINTHTNFLSYSNVWDACKATDLDPDDVTNTNVILIYGYNDSDGNYITDRTRSKNLNGGTAGTEWNREHSYPKSLGTPNLNTSGPGSDAHHLRPSDITFNGQRGSLLFDDGTGNAGASGSGWYPGDEWKGDIARMMMYMYLRYGTQCLPDNVIYGTTNSVDSNMIDLLLDWNAADPVSLIEQNRNTYHENTSNSYAQGNRNPFIDEPYLATLIWGGTAAEDPWNLSGPPDSTPPSDPTNLATSNPTPTTIDLNWTASTDNIAVSSYDVYVNGAFYVNTNSSSTFYTVTGLTASTTYSFTVLAKDAANNASNQSSSVNGTTDAPDTTAPSVPTNLLALNPTSTEIDLSWTASTDNIAVTDYDIYINAAYFASTGSNSTNYTASGLTPETTYSFTVLAKDASNNQSGQSTAANGTTLAGSSDCVAETFESIPSNNSAYTSRTWTGDDGFTWNATDARTDQTLSTRAITIRNGNLTSSSVAGGIGSLTVTTKLIFSGSSGTFDLKVNGVSKGSIPYSSTETTTTIPDINTTGNVTIVFDSNSSASNRVIFDDLSWTCHSGTLDISSKELTNLKFYPNPLHGDKLYIDTNQDLNIKIFNVLGQEVLKDIITSNKSFINLSNLNKGIYLVLLSNDKDSITKKLLRE